MRVFLFAAAPHFSVIFDASLLLLESASSAPTSNRNDFGKFYTHLNIKVDNVVANSVVREGERDGGERVFFAWVFLFMYAVRMQIRWGQSLRVVGVMKERRSSP